MKRILLIILMLATTAKAQPFMSVPQSSTISFSVDTLGSTGTLTNADNSPWFGIYDYVNSGTTALATGTFNAGTAAVGNAGHYYGTLSLNSSTYTVGRLYTIEAVGTVSGVVGGKTVAYVYVLPAQTTSGYNLVDARSSTGTAAGSQGGLLLIGANSGTLSLSGAATLTGGIDTATLTANRFAITNGISAATLSTSGTASLGSLLITNQLSAGSSSLGNIAGTLAFATAVGSGTIDVVKYLNGSISVDRFLNSGSMTLTGLNGSGSLHFGSAVIDSAVTVGGTLTVIGPISASTVNFGTFNVGAGSVNLGSFTASNGAIGTTSFTHINLTLDQPVSLRGGTIGGP